MNIFVLIPFVVVGIFILLVLIWFMGYIQGRKDAHEFAVQMLCDKKDKADKEESDDTKN